jgi:hypothetical protein
MLEVLLLLLLRLVTREAPLPLPLRLATREMEDKEYIFFQSFTPHSYLNDPFLTPPQAQ